MNHIQFKYMFFEYKSHMYLLYKNIKKENENFLGHYHQKTTTQYISFTPVPESKKPKNFFY